MSEKEVKNIDLELKSDAEGKVSAVFSVFNSLDSDGDIVLPGSIKSGFKSGSEISICLDIAANELFKDGKYAVSSSKFLSPEKTVLYYLDLIKKYPIKSIEDPFSEDDWDSWVSLTKSINQNTQIVGDDLFVTSSERLSKGINLKAANTILIAKLRVRGSIRFPKL